ncbi:MAG TPA: MFS transporter [Mycobacteriales bacterium]|nr:MFS transporter [Mycobacteriales bacterium]
MTRSTPEQRGWYWYDWANSVFTTSVTTVFLGPYLSDVAETAAGGPGRSLHLLGIPISPDSVFPYLLSLSALVQVFVLPAVGALADRTRRKKQILGVLAYVGSLATAALFFVADGRWALGVVLFLLANTCFGASVVVYYSWLPEIAGPDDRDAVSSRGWAWGYLGGGLLLALNLVLFLDSDGLGLSEGDAVRICFVSVAAWWAAFTVIPLRRLRDRPAPGVSWSSRRSASAAGAEAPTAAGSFRQLGRTLRELRGYPQTWRFLLAYLLFNDGIQSVIGLAAQYGDRELELSQTVLISTILLVQFVAFGGALLFGRIAARYGAKRTVLGSLVVWVVVLLFAFGLQKGSAVQFSVLGAAIGVVLGGTQALTRSLFGQLTPVGKEAEYYGLYEISDRGTSWLGTLAFGVAVQLTGSYRIAIVSLVVFFVLGFALLTRVDVRAAAAEARGELAVLL